jgi:hypothetical protein
MFRGLARKTGIRQPYQHTGLGQFSRQKLQTLLLKEDSKFGQSRIILLLSLLLLLLSLLISSSSNNSNNAAFFVVAIFILFLPVVTQSNLYPANGECMVSC